jgi:hypothetical protein
MTSQTAPTTDEKNFPEYPKLEDVDEAKLIWEEYRYRHDLKGVE